MFKFCTALSALIKLELTPILVDIDIETLQIDINKIENAISKNKSIDDPNLIGNTPDWIKINKIAKKYKLKIIEDYGYIRSNN